MGEKPDPQEKKFTIVVNATPTVVHDPDVTYEQVVTLAFPKPAPDVTYSVAYRGADGPHGGTGVLVAGESVKVKKEGTIFDVDATTRS
jgi:hypothetical protein